MRTGKHTPYCSHCSRVKKSKRKPNGKTESRSEVYKNATCGLKACIESRQGVKSNKRGYPEKARPDWEINLDNFIYARAR